MYAYICKSILVNGNKYANNFYGQRDANEE